MLCCSRGFVVEGRKRKANWAKGKWGDIILMSIVDEEYWTVHPEETA
jgi:hypothetical protein